MPFDLRSISRGYGECVAEWRPPDAPDDAVADTITLRYHVRLTGREARAMSEMAVGQMTMDGKTRLPNFDAVIAGLLKLLLPVDHEYGPGWDLTRDGEVVPITEDELLDLPLGLPAMMFNAVIGDMNDPNRKRPSPAGSRMRASSESHPTTTASSATPNGRASLPGPLPASEAPLAVGTAGDSGFGV